MATFWHVGVVHGARLIWRVRCHRRKLDSMAPKDNLVQTLIDIQDYLVPMLDTYEQALYHYILRHTLLVGKTSAVISVKTANIGLGKAKVGSHPSENVKSRKNTSVHW